ncbi:MAG: 16S rRNA processing protein RimM [Tidjanibacter sp.]|nr:16S rRNA processing protein RimM [Tidjanibacter sp.]
MSNLPVGKFTKLYGTEGEVVANLYDRFPADYDSEEPLFVSINSLTVPLFISSFVRRGRGAVIAIDDYDTPRRSEELLGREFYATNPDAEVAAYDGEDDEAWSSMEELLGWRVTFVGRKEEGEIVGYNDDEINPLFEVEVDGKDVYVPVVDEFIRKISRRKREIKFQLPEGLLELYL